MFQLDRLLYATARPDALERFLTGERGLIRAADGTSFPGIATRIYPFAGGGHLEVAYVEDATLVGQSEEGKALQAFLADHGDGFYAMVLETDELDRVKAVLEEEGYPVAEAPVQELTDPDGTVVRFRMVGTYPHLPWFVQYDQPRKAPRGYPQAAIIRSATLSADVSLMEKLLGCPATMLDFADTRAAVLPLANATLRIESADEYGFAYLDPKGLLATGQADA